jgi:hypothetical protein
LFGCMCRAGVPRWSTQRVLSLRLVLPHEGL